MVRACFTVAMLLLAKGLEAAAGKPVPVIFDTDMGNDIDDALALAMLHALENRGEAKLVAVTITKDNAFAAPFVDVVNTFYGRPAIPIGVVHDGKTPEDTAYIRDPVLARNPDQSSRFPRRLQDGSQAQEAVSLLQSVLAQQPDASVTIVQVGFSTNLARLLQTAGGAELAKQKVKQLVLMAGNFAGGEPEYNVYTDPNAAAVLFEKWPTPMIFSGFEIGKEITFPYAAFATGFAHPDIHPIVAASQSFFKKPEDRPAWDPTAVLYAIRPKARYFELSPRGAVTLGPNNTTLFTPDLRGRCRYLVLDLKRSHDVRQALVNLVTEPPRRMARR